MGNIQESIERIKLTGNYKKLLDRLQSAESANQSFKFELLFANEFELNNISLLYEDNINPANNNTIDFVYQAGENAKILFELVRPEMSEVLQSEWEQNLYTDGVLLSSDNDDEKLRPEAQTIRLQEKLLEKVEKFPEPNDEYFSVIVMDCSNFHYGHFDDEDARISMYGVPKKPILLEQWNGKRILGMLEKEFTKKNVITFQRKISAVVFIQKLRTKNILSEAKIISNCLRTETHRILFQNKIDHLPPFNNVNWL